jgi:hypothetical protein
MDFSQAEPRWSEDARVVARTLRRARSRPVAALVTAAVAALAAVIANRGGSPSEARVVIQISETSLSRERGVLGRGALLGWVADAALSSDRLKAVLEEQGLYPEAWARGPEHALEELWKNLEIEVFADYFLEHQTDSHLRTARVALVFQDEDRERATEIAVALARAVIAFETEHRREIGEHALETASLVVDRARRELEARQRQISETLVQLETGGEIHPAAAEVHVRRLSETLEASRRAMRHAELQREALRLKLAAEEAQLAQRFRIASLQRPPVPKLSRGELLAVVGTVAFLLSLPFSALGVGAFDARVRDPEDARAFGLPLVAVVSPGEARPAPISRRKDLE